MFYNKKNQYKGQNFAKKTVETYLLSLFLFFFRKKKDIFETRQKNYLFHMDPR